ncbi:hypothetical protein [Flavobacterium sp.]|uniref:hypothetical protein n=1 Tax=Flavobacterium sp. TaxID=239 RepID=UPI00261310F5|nr:hypothetical protein [Flavobacterium sp.]
MKKIFLLFLFIITTVNVFAQVGIGEVNYFNESSKKNKQKDIDRLKTKKTIFVLPDIYSIKEYDEILSGTWKINQYEVITTQEFYNNITKYKITSNAIAQFYGYSLITKHQDISRSDTEHIFFVLRLYLIDDINVKKKETVYEQTYLSTAFFTLDYPQLSKEKIVKLLDAKPKHLYNYKLGYLKNYFQKINNDLVNNSNFNCFDEFKNKEKLKELKTKKLVFTDEIVRKNLSVTGNLDNREEDDLLSKYEFDNEVISIDELNKRILNNEEFYYFTYSQINAKKILTITNSKTGEVIYNYMNRMSFNIKRKDFKQISNEISKS